MKTIAAYGTWTSSVTGEFVAGRSSKMGEPQWAGRSLFWLETRPAEQGRQTILCRAPDGTIRELLPNPWNARTKIHEYGGGSFVPTEQTVFFVNAEDQQIYSLSLVDGSVAPLTQTQNCRYGDLHYSRSHHCLFAVCEDHSKPGAEPTNRLVTVNIITGNFHEIETTHDFVSSAQMSPDGTWLAYLTWDHPNMPWQTTQLWLRQLEDGLRIGPARRVAVGASIAQPRWSPAGDLYWVSDQNEWWNLFWLQQDELAVGAGALVLAMEAEFAPPQWVCGQRHYDFLSDREILVSYNQRGSWTLAQLEQHNTGWKISPPLLPECCAVHQLACGEGEVAVLGATATSTQSLWLRQAEKASFEVLIEQAPLAPDDIALARAVTFIGGNGHQSHGFFYAPRNSRFEAPSQTLPPVIVIGHGGPTSATDPSLNFKIQFWTQRGFAVFDVNYRGSTGFGRTYRKALDGQWGLADVEDLCAAAEYATTQGWVHPRQRIIRGSSAGGYSVLAALTDRNVFNAGVSLYGIGDLETLAQDTHKFEAHYLDSLVGPYPAARALYKERSPLHKAENIRCPLLVFQGLQDKVVPPAQAEQMVNAVRGAGVPVAYITYAEEGHGFRRAETIQHQLDSELAFYGAIFRFDEATASSPITIDNWPEPRP